MDFGANDLERVGADGDAAELQACHFALEQPRVAVDVEDAAAQKIAEDCGEWLAFGVVVKLGFEDVLHVLGVGGDDVAEDVEVDGSGGRFSEEMRVPIAEVVEVLGPAGAEEAPAHVAVAPWPEPDDEDKYGEERKQSGEGEEEEAEGAANGVQSSHFFKREERGNWLGMDGEEEGEQEEGVFILKEWWVS